MELYLVYEFVYHDCDECREEEIDFFGLYKDKSDAIKVANARVKKGIEDFNLVISKDEVSNIENPFSERDCISMYRSNYDDDDIVEEIDDEFDDEDSYGNDIVAPVYDICIKKLKIEGKEENE